MHLSINIACRPIRLGFLVHPHSKAELLAAIEANTILWGGIYNPIIPYYTKTPRILKNRLSGNPTPRELVKGYVATFQPDYLVCPDDMTPPGGIVPSKRLLHLSQVLSIPSAGEFVASQSPICFGLDMMDIYGHAYDTDWRFVLREPRQAVLTPNAKGRFKLLAAALWGKFPEHNGFGEYEREWEHVFQAKQSPIDALTTLFPRNMTPIRLTRYHLKPRVGFRSPCVLLVDENSSPDVIDFWNLRAAGHRCIPLPYSCVVHLAAEFREFMNSNLRKVAFNDDKLTYPSLVSSNCAVPNDFRNVAMSLPLDPGHRKVISYYPRFWSPLYARWDHSSPTPFVHSDKLEHVNADENSVTIAALDPEFAARFGRHGPRWSNTIAVQSFHPPALPADVIPDGLYDISGLFGPASPASVWSGEEGIVLSCEHRDWSHRLRLPEAAQVGKEWADTQGYTLTISDKGRILQSMVHVAEGLSGGRWFANENIIKSFASMAQGTPVHVDRLREEISKANAAEHLPNFMTTRHFEILKELGVLRLCLKVQCPNCRQYPDYVLEDLAHSVSCRHCLREFAFPIDSPPKTDWHLRAVGPFASPDLAGGAYSVLLALRFLSDQLEAPTTCVPSCRMTKKGVERELDFICFWKRRSWQEHGGHVIIGECKSFSSFEAKDISRIAETAAEFPGSIVAFCTLKRALDAKEKSLIGKLAERGRKPKKDSFWPLPVLVLTANELCILDPHGFSHQRYNKKSKGLAQRLPYEFGMFDLCDASQVEYLGLPSVQEVRDTYFEKLRRSRERSRGKKTMTPIDPAGIAVPAVLPPRNTDTNVASLLVATRMPRIGPDSFDG